MLLRTLAALLVAGAAHAAEPGYLIKQADGAAVYLDAGKGASPAVGQRFRIYVPGEAIKHPVTGEDLGTEEKALAEGVITELREKFVVGKTYKVDGALKAGQRVRLLEAAPAAPVEAAPAAAAKNAGRDPAWKSPQFDYEVVSIAVGDFAEAPGPEFAVAGEKTLTLYRLDGEALAPLAAFDVDSGEEIHYVDEVPGKRAVMVTTYHSFYKRTETRILELLDGKLKTTWRVRAMMRTENGTMYGQNLEEGRMSGLGVIRPRGFDGKQLEPNGDALSIPRLEWLYNFEFADFDKDGTRDVVYCHDSSKIRVQFELSSYADSERGYCRGRNRLKWKKETRPFTPRLLAHAGGAAPAVFAVNNTAGSGSLAAAFGRYTRGKIEKLRFDGVGLEPEWFARLSGYGADLALADVPGFGETLVAAVVGSNKKSSLWFFPKP